MHLGQAGTDGLDNEAADEPQARNEGNAHSHHDRQRDGDFVRNPVGLQDIEDGGEGADGVGDVVRAVREREGGGGEDLHPREKKEGRAGQGLLLQGAGEDEDGHPDHGAYHAHDKEVLQRGEVNAGVLEALEEHHRGDDNSAQCCQQRDPVLQCAVRVNVLEILVEVVQISVVVGLEGLWVVIIFRGEGGITGHGVGVGNLLQLVHALEAGLVLLAQLSAANLDVAQTLVCGVVVDEDGSLNPPKQQVSGNTAKNW